MAREFTPGERAAAIEYMQNMRADEGTFAETKTFIDSNTGKEVTVPRFDYLDLGDRLIMDPAIFRTLPLIQENFENLPLDFQQYVIDGGKLRDTQSLPKRTKLRPEGQSTAPKPQTTKTNASVPVVPVEPAVPVALVEPVEPAVPVVPVAPAVPVAPVESVEPVAPAVPVAPVESVEPVVPAVPVAPVESVEPVVPTTNIEATSNLTPAQAAFFGEAPAGAPEQQFNGLNLTPAQAAFFGVTLEKEEEKEKLTADQLPLSVLLGGAVDSAAQGAVPGFEPGTGIGDSYVAKGLGLTMEQFKAVPTIVSLQATAASLARLQELIPGFDRIDTGEFAGAVINDITRKNEGPQNLQQADLLSRYARGDEATRAQLRQEITENSATQLEDLKTIVPAMLEFQAKMAKYTEGVPEFSNIESAEDFRKWLTFHGVAGTAQLLPIIISTALLGPVGGFTVATSLGLEEATNDRFKFIYDKIKNLPEDVQAELIAEYIAETKDTTLAQAVATGALEKLGSGFVISKTLIKKIATKQGLKEASQEIISEVKDINLKKETIDILRALIGEGGTEGAQQALSIVQKIRLQELEGNFFTTENMLEIANAAAAGAAGATGVKGVQKIGASGIRNWQADTQKNIQDAFFASPELDPIIKGYVKSKMEEGLSFNDAILVMQEEILGKKITVPFNLPDVQQLIDINEISDKNAQGLINQTFRILQSGKYKDSEVDLIAARGEVLVDGGMAPAKAFSQAEKEFSDGNLKADTEPRTEQETAPEETVDATTTPKETGQLPLDFGDPQGDLFAGQSLVDPNVMPGVDTEQETAPVDYADERTNLMQQHAMRVGEEKQKIVNKIKAYNRKNSQTKITEADLKEAEQQALTARYAGSKPNNARQLQLDFSRPLTDRIVEGIINETGTVVDQYPSVQAEAIYDRAVSLIDDGATVPNAFNRAKKELANGTLELPDTQLNLDFGSQRGRPQRVDKTARQTEQRREKLTKKYPLPKILADQKVEQTQGDFFFNTLSTPLETRQLDSTKVTTTEVQKSFDRELTSKQSEAIVNSTFKLLGRYQDAEAFAVYQRARNLINSGMSVPVAFKKANAEYAKGEIPVSRGLPQNQQLDLALKEKKQPKRRFTDAKQMSLPGLEYQEGPSTFDAETGKYVGPATATSTEGQQGFDFTFDRLETQRGRKTVFPTSEKEFKTAQGSTYKVQLDGQVLRTTGDTTYAASPTLYVNPKTADKLDTDKGILRLGYDDNGTFKTVSNPNQIPEGAKPQIGFFNPRNNQLIERYSAFKQPEVGLHPVEKRYNSDGTATTYVGRNISNISTSTEVAERKTLVIDQKKLNETYNKLDDNVGFGEEQLREQADAISSFIRQTRNNLPQTVLNILINPKGVAIGMFDAALIALDNRDLRRVWKGLGEFDGNDTDHFSEIIKLNNLMHGGHKDIIENYAEIIGRWKKFNKSKEEGAKLAETMNESTRVNVDPTLYASAQDAINKKPDLSPYEIRMVFDAYNSLSAEGKKLFVDVRDAYDGFFKLYETTLLGNIRRLGLSDKDEAEAIKSIQDEFTAARSGVEIYFPLKRHGDFWLRISSGPDVGLYTYETEAELQVHVDKANKQNLNIEFGDKNNNPIRQELQENSIVKNLFQTIDNATQKKNGSKVNAQELKNQVLELYLQTQPGNNLRSAFAKRKGTKGYSPDVLRSFAVTVNTMANTLPKLEYGQQMRMELSAMNSQVAGMPNQLRLNAITSELRKRIDGELTAPASSPLGSVLGLGNKAVFLYFMTTGKAAIIQTFQYAMVVGPTLQQKYGKDLGNLKVFAAHKRYVNAFTRLGLGDRPGFMGKAKLSIQNSYYINNHKNSALLKEGWKVANDQNKFETTFTGDVADLARLPDGMTTGMLDKTKKGVRVGFEAVAMLFHNAERLTREFSYMLALELGLERAQKQGLKGQAALDKAIEDAFDVLDEAMFDYSNFNKPRIFKTGPLAKGITQFMSFPYFANSLMMRNFVNMIKPLGENDRRDAAKLFFGVQVNALFFAGLSGMYGYSTVIAPVLQGIMNSVLQGIDDDEEDEKLKLLSKYGKTPDGEKPAVENEIKAYNRTNSANRITKEDLDAEIERTIEAYIAGDPFHYSSIEVWTNKWFIPYIFADKGMIGRFLNDTNVPSKVQDAIRLAFEKGIFAGLTGVDLSRSLSLDGFWVKDRVSTPNDGIFESLYKDVENTGIFPQLALVGQLYDGFVAVEDGDYAKGAKKLTPGFAKGAVDYSQKLRTGTLDYKGSQIPGLDAAYYREAGKIVGGILGFSRARETQISSLSYQLNTFEKGVASYRDSIIEKYSKNWVKANQNFITNEEFFINLTDILELVDLYNNKYGEYPSYKKIDNDALDKRVATRLEEGVLTKINFGVATPQQAAKNLYRLNLIARFLGSGRERKEELKKLIADAEEKSKSIITNAIESGQ